MGRKRAPKAYAASEVQHVRLHRWLTETPAWRSLSCVARCLYLEMKQKFNGMNNGRLGLGRDEAMRLLNIGSEHTFMKARQELVDRGFVKVAAAGSFQFKTGARQGQVTEFSLTEYSYAGGEPTKEFMHWRSTESTLTKNKTRVQRKHPLGAEHARERVQSVHSSGAECAPSGVHNGASTGAERAHHIIYQGGGPSDDAHDSPSRDTRTTSSSSQRGRRYRELEVVHVHELETLLVWGWNYAGLASRLGVNPGAPKLWRSGARRPSAANRDALAQLVATGEAPP